MEEQKEALSERELEILRLVATGAANKEIARQLVISPNTVKVHLRNIFTKIGVASRTEATLYAINIGLVKPWSGSGSIDGTQQDYPEPQMSAELPGMGPAVAVEDPTATPQPSLKPWQIGFGLLFILILVITSIIGIRLMNPPAVTPTITSQSQINSLITQRWSIKASMPSPRKGMGFIEYNDSFYLVGGETSQGIDGALLLYEPASNSWKTLKGKPTPVTDVRAALLGEKIYVPGGRLKDGTSTNVLEIYDPRHNSWEKKAPLPIPLNAYALASFEGQLYLFGGKNNDTYASTVYSYDPKEDRWQERSPLDSPRAYAGTAVLNGKILVIGGFNGQHALRFNQAYFPNRDASGENAWEDYQPLPGERYAMGVTQLAGFVFVIGGIDDEKNSATSTLQYVSPTDQWTELDSPPLAVGAFPAMLASGNLVYLCGGEASGNLLATNQAYQAIYTISVPIIGN